VSAVNLRSRIDWREWPRPRINRQGRQERQGNAGRFTTKHTKHTKNEKSGSDRFLPVGVLRVFRGKKAFPLGALGVLGGSNKTTLQVTCRRTGA
jgi:hypothetical protein